MNNKADFYVEGGTQRVGSGVLVERGGTPERFVFSELAFDEKPYAGFRQGTVLTVMIRRDDASPVLLDHCRVVQFPQAGDERLVLQGTVLTD